MKIMNPVGSDSRARPRPFSFRPPRNSRFVSALCRLLLPFNLRSKLKVNRIEIDDNSLSTLRSLRGKRCLLTPSHSGGFEPYVLVHLSHILGDDFNYMAARESFSISPLVGWIMQGIGAYSVIRGTADRPSFQMTKQLLLDAKRWLVVFPEGQTVWQGDTVIPFQPGLIQLAFKAFEQVSGNDPGASLLCVPMAVKYIYTKNMQDEIDTSLSRLEASLVPEPASPDPGPLDRLRVIAESVLASNEKMRGIEPVEGDSMDDRIQRMKESVIRRIESRLDVIPRAHDPLIDRVRALFNAVDRIVYKDTEGTEYEHTLLAEQQRAARDFYDDLWRVLQFVAIYEGYVREALTVERFMDVLCLLEMEVFGARRIWGPRKAVVRVGDPLDLRYRFEAYRADKRAVIHSVSLELETAVRRMLKELSTEHCTPLTLP